MAPEEPLCRFERLVAWKAPTGEVTIDHGSGTVRVAAGDQLHFSWGGMGSAAIGTTPFYLLHRAAGGAITELYKAELLDEDPTRDYRGVLAGLTAFIAGVAKAVDVAVIQD
jgi:hypothetical protein